MAIMTPDPKYLAKLKNGDSISDVHTRGDVSEMAYSKTDPGITFFNLERRAMTGKVAPKVEPIKMIKIEAMRRPK